MFSLPTSSPLTLASGSTIRQKMLNDAGVPFHALSVDVDENSLRNDAHALSLSPKETAAFLADAKAHKASSIPQLHDHIIIAADQILEFENTIINKASSLKEAHHHLTILRGKTHHLHTNATLWSKGRQLWSFTQTATLTMRHFSDEFLSHYLHQEGDNILYCVGCYRFEGPGIHLFSHKDGDTEAILGLPLFPLIRALYEQGILLK